MALFETRCVIRLAALASLMPAGIFGDVELKVSYGAQGPNSSAPSKNAWSLIADQTITLDSSKKLLIPCSVSYNSVRERSEGVIYLLSYFTKSETQPKLLDMPAHPDMSETSPKCAGNTGVVASVPDDINFIVLYTDPASSDRLQPPGTRAVFVKIERTPQSADDAKKTPNGKAANSTAGADTSPGNKAQPSSGETTLLSIIAAVASFIALLVAAFAFGLVKRLSAKIVELQNGIPVELGLRLLKLENFADGSSSPKGSAAPLANSDSRIDVLNVRVQNLEAAQGGNAPPFAEEGIQRPGEIHAEASMEAGVLAMLERIEDMKTALDIWSHTAPQAAERDVKEYRNELRRLGEQVQLARNFDQGHLEIFWSCSRSAAMKVVFAADTSVDPERIDPQVQSTVARVVAAAKLELIEPPLNSNPREHDATVLSNTVQGSGDYCHSGVAKVARRGLRNGAEVIERPQVYVFD